MVCFVDGDGASWIPATCGIAGDCCVIGHGVKVVKRAYFEDGPRPLQIQRFKCKTHKKVMSIASEEVLGQLPEGVKLSQPVVLFNQTWLSWPLVHLLMAVWEVTFCVKAVRDVILQVSESNGNDVDDMLSVKFLKCFFEHVFDTFVMPSWLKDTQRLCALVGSAVGYDETYKVAKLGRLYDTESKVYSERDLCLMVACSLHTGHVVHCKMTVDVDGGAVKEFFKELVSKSPECHCKHVAVDHVDRYHASILDAFREHGYGEQLPSVGSDLWHDMEKLVKLINRTRNGSDVAVDELREVYARVAVSHDKAYEDLAEFRTELRRWVLKYCAMPSMLSSAAVVEFLGSDSGEAASAFVVTSRLLHAVELQCSKAAYLFASRLSFNMLRYTGTTVVERANANLQVKRRRHSFVHADFNDRIMVWRFYQYNRALTVSCLEHMQDADVKAEFEKLFCIRGMPQKLEDGRDVIACKQGYGRSNMATHLAAGGVVPITAPTVAAEIEKVLHDLLPAAWSVEQLVRDITDRVKSCKVTKKKVKRAVMGAVIAAQSSEVHESLQSASQQVIDLCYAAMTASIRGRRTTKK